MSLESALALAESVKDYRILVAGDAIIDEYHYVQPLSKAAKEHLIPMRYLREEVFEGGVVAAANHVRSFCKSVVVWKSSETVRKVRMVDENQLRKLAEIHYNEPTRDMPSGRPISNVWKGGACLPYDVVVLTDFGHGAISNENAVQWSGKDCFLAISAQSNSANMGFNLITKYPRADYIVIDEPEARLAAADREGPIEDVMRKLARGRCERFVVTHGKHGAYGYDHGRFLHCKSSTDLVRDTMGAGDAFFAVTAPMAKTGSMEDLLAIGCAAGALKTQIIGHRQSVTKEALIAYLTR